MTMSSGFLEVLLGVSIMEEEEGGGSLHCCQSGWGPDVVQDGVESFLGHCAWVGGR